MSMAPWSQVGLNASLYPAAMADKAMGGAARLLWGGSRPAYAAGFLAVIVSLEVWIRYERQARARSVVAVLARLCHYGFLGACRLASGARESRAHRLPGHHYATALAAIAGTTISFYLLFWQAGQEAEIAERDPTKEPLVVRPAQAPRELRRIRFDTYIGMALSQIVGFFIIVTAAATLGAHGITHVDTASAAASALAPLAGPWTSALFAAGLVATGLLAIPAMAGACA